MTETTTPPATLARLLAPASERLMLLDFDGVLAPIVDRPDLAAASPQTLAAVRELTDRTTVAIVSGRPIDDLVPRLDGLPVIYAGGHGAELQQPDGHHQRLIDVDAVARVLDDLEERIRDLVDLEPGWLVERKEASLAVHHRLAPFEQVDELLPRIAAIFDATVDLPPGFSVLNGKAVVELRPAGVDKGRALDVIADQRPDLSPVVIGDDTTDEDAFRAANARGGTGILVAEHDRPTAASFRIEDPEAVTALLSELAALDAEVDA